MNSFHWPRISQRPETGAAGKVQSPITTMCVHPRAFAATRVLVRSFCSVYPAGALLFLVVCVTQI